MDSREEIENDLRELYKSQTCIDFSKITDDFNQAKVTLYMMEVAEFGLQKIIHESQKQILFIMEGENQYNSKEEREEIERINSDISLCEETIEKIDTERNEIIKRFWSEECEASERDIIDILELKNKKREFESDLAKQKVQELRDPFRQKSSSREEMYKKLLAAAREDLEEYSPFNDPDNKYGWKEFCYIREKLYVQSLEKSLEQIKIDDKQDTPPRSGDKGTESKENSLSPLNSSNESQGSSGCKDSGISSDETSTSPERNSVKIGYSKMEMPLIRSMEKQSVSPHSNDGRIGLLCYRPKKKIERLGTPIEVTDDKQDTPPRSGDRGIEAKENSLSPLNSTNQSKGSSVPQDSGISSDETSTSPERKGVKIDYSKVKKTLERLMGTDENQQHSQRYQNLSASNDTNVRVLSYYLLKRSLPYRILTHRALLDFCERHLLNPPADYLLLGLGYVRFKQTNVVLTN